MTHSNCPTCGAKVSAVIANCEYCGTELKRAAQLSTDEYIGALKRSIDEYRKRATEADDDDGELYPGKAAEAKAIGMFPLPSEISLLTEFFAFCHGNCKTGLGAWGDEVNDAWKAKAKAAYTRLRLASLNNPQLTGFLEEFKATYSNDAPKKGLFGRLFG
ncbi:MAG: hypothetical protein KA257_05820 [Opitutaceae bacterium]|nr:hypothetical protein [Opitutaceae bacterium]MBP9911900.1 hypothetical protein [Opitutaceae bacterium]